MTKRKEPPQPAAVTSSSSHVSKSQKSSSKSSSSSSSNSQSPFYLYTLSSTVSLPPSCLADVPQAIRLSLNSLIMKYSSAVRGVIVTVGELKFGAGANAGVGRIQNELPHIHFDVGFEALVFRPNVAATQDGEGGESARTSSSRHGGALPGTINKVSGGHVGMLVYGVFNASISGEVLEAHGFVFRPSSSDSYADEGDEGEEEAGSAGTWCNAKTGAVLKEGMDVNIVATDVKEVGGVIAIEGRPVNL